MAGEGVELTTLTPPGAEPHDLELSARSIARLRDADAVVYIGGGFQPSLEAALRDSGVRAIDVLKVPRIDLRTVSRSALDPHVWLDPRRFALVARWLAGELELDPKKAIAALDRLDSDFRAGLAQCERSQVFTSHAAFGYMTSRYRLEQVAISGLSPESEPRPRDLKRVAERARQTNATTIFFEPLISPKLSETVASELGAKTAVLDPIEGISQQRQDRGEDYLSVMRGNLAALRAGLGCR